MIETEGEGATGVGRLGRHTRTRDDDVDTTRVSKGLHLGCNRVFRRRHVRVRGEARRGDDDDDDDGDDGAGADGDTR